MKDFTPKLGRQHHQYPLMRKKPMARASVKPAALKLANKGRFGDNTLVHMNKGEADFLSSMVPGGLTKNPRTGLPEAFKLWDLVGPVVGLGSAAVGVPPMWGALAAGAAQTAATGDITKGVTSGLMSYGLGNAADMLAAKGTEAATAGMEDIAKSAIQTAGQSPIQTAGTGSMSAGFANPTALPVAESAKGTIPDVVAKSMVTPSTSGVGNIGTRMDMIGRGLTSGDAIKDVFWKNGLKTTAPIALGIVSAVPQPKPKRYGESSGGSSYAIPGAYGYADGGEVGDAAGSSVGDYIVEYPNERTQRRFREMFDPSYMGGGNTVWDARRLAGMGERAKRRWATYQNSLPTDRMPSQLPGTGVPGAMGELQDQGFGGLPGYMRGSENQFPDTQGYYSKGGPVRHFDAGGPATSSLYWYWDNPNLGRQSSTTIDPQHQAQPVYRPAISPPQGYRPGFDPEWAWFPTQTQLPYQTTGTYQNPYAATNPLPGAAPTATGAGATALPSTGSAALPNNIVAPAAKWAPNAGIGGLAAAPQQAATGASAPMVDYSQPNYGGPAGTTGGISAGPANQTAQAIAQALSLAAPAPVSLVSGIATGLGLMGINGALGIPGIGVINSQSTNNVNNDVAAIQSAIQSFLGERGKTGNVQGLTPGLAAAVLAGGSPAVSPGSIAAGLANTGGGPGAASPGGVAGATASAGEAGGGPGSSASSASSGDSDAFRRGGMIHRYGLGGFVDGPGDGQSDSVPATIEGQQPAALSDGEFVVPADVVSALGSGSTKAGVQQLEQMIARIRRMAYGHDQQANPVDASQVMPT